MLEWFLGICMPILSHHLPCQLYSWCPLRPSLAFEFGEVPFVLQQASADASPYHTIPSIQPAHNSAALPHIVLIGPTGPPWAEVHGWFHGPINNNKRNNSDNHNKNKNDHKIPNKYKYNNKNNFYKYKYNNKNNIDKYKYMNKDNKRNNNYNYSDELN